MSLVDDWYTFLGTMFRGNDQINTECELYISADTYGKTIVVKNPKFTMLYYYYVTRILQIDSFKITES